jgi:hypothetical protein
MLERFGPVIGGLVVMALLVVWSGDPDDDVPAEPPSVGGQEAVDEFLAAYERSWMVEAVVVSETQRTMADGRELAYEQRLVQRPPDDRLVIGAGSASGRVDGQTVRCTTVDDDPVPQCADGGEAPDYQALVDEQLETFAELVEPGVGMYTLTSSEDGCFHLELRLRVLTPPYGIESTFCFDEEVGVLRDVEVVRPEATDRTTATEIRATVTEADLRATDVGDPLSTE